MSSPTPAPTRERHAAQQTRAAYGAMIDKVRSSSDLTENARNRRVAELHNNMRSELKELQQQERGRLTAKRGQLERQLFAPSVARPGASPSDLISLRDAQDRASQVRTAEDAGALLNRAEDSQDEPLAASVARHALRQVPNALTRDAANDWLGVVRRYVEHPARADRLVPIAQQMDDIDNHLAPPANGWDPDFSTIPPAEARGVNMWAGRAVGLSDDA